MSKPGLLTLTIKDKSALYLAYMPFIKNGGLFIPTNSSYKLGDEVFMLLNVMGEEEKIPVAGRVIWITPGPWTDATVRVMLSGNTVGTKMLVGPLRVSTGLAPGINWDLRDSPPEP